MDTNTHTMQDSRCTVCGSFDFQLEEVGAKMIDATQPKGLRVSGVRHDDAHSLRVDRSIAPGAKEARTFWCTCGHKFSRQYDTLAIRLYRAHRKA